ncbi:hypothetical protein ACX12E_19025 [Paenibacillus vandeheii]
MESKKTIEPELIETGWQPYCNHIDHAGHSWGECYTTSAAAQKAVNLHNNKFHRDDPDWAGNVQGSCRKPTGDFGDDELEEKNLLANKIQ